MPDLTEQEIYKKEYDEALAKLEGTAEEEATTPEPEPEPESTPEPEKKPVIEEVKTEEPDPLAELRAKLEKTEKALNDTKAWGTKNAQRLAEIERRNIEQQREQAKPEILDANPELADAIRYVTQDPTPQHKIERQMQDWQAMVQTAHPGIFDLSIDPELESALVAKREALGEAWFDPLIAIREITAEKLAFTERQVSKRLAAEAAKQSQKSAMSVPGSGGSANRTAPDTDQEAVQRIQKMSPADFEKERRKVLGY